MTSTVLATYDSIEDARAAVNDLTEAGFNRSDIGLALYDHAHAYETYVNDEDIDAEEGTGIGAVTGSLLGAVAGLGLIVIPGIGPIIAAGPLAAGLGALAGAAIGGASGAVTGGIIGSLVELGVSEEESHYYAESLRRGAALVSVTAHEGDVQHATDILYAHHPIDIDRRVAQWRKQGWTGYDPKVEPYTSEQLAMLPRDHDEYGFNDLADDQPDADEEYPRAVRSYEL